MGWLVARTDMPLRRTVRALVTASFVTPPFLGAIAWELLAAPNSGLLNKIYRAADRRAAGRVPVQHLFAAGPDLRHLLLHLPLCVRAARQCARPHSRRPRGRVVDPRRPRLDHGAAHHHPAGPAGAARRRARRLPAGHDAVRLAGDPGDSRRLPHHDHQDLEPVQVSAQARAGRGGVAAAADPHRGAAARRAHHPRPPRLFRRGRQAGRSAADQARLAQMGGARFRASSS